MPVTMITDVHTDAKTIVSDVPFGCALLDVPLTVACGLFGALAAHGVTVCPMVHAGDRIIFLVRPEVDFVVRADSTRASAPLSLTYWPSTMAALDAGAAWADDTAVWLLPPVCVADELPDTTTILQAICAAANSNSNAAPVNALTWRLALDQLRTHATGPGTKCGVCGHDRSCAALDLAVDGLHVALGHANADVDYWHGLTRIRQTQAPSAVN